MKNPFCFVLLVSLTFIQYRSNAQNRTIDSLKTALQLPQEDTSRVKILFELAQKIKDKEIWPVYNNQMLILAEARFKQSRLKSAGYIFYSKYYSAALNNIGYLADTEGDVPKALENYFKALKIREDAQDEKQIATTLNNIAVVYHSQGESAKALEFYMRSMRTRSRLKDNIGLSKCLNNIALIYINKGKADSARKYSTLALKTEEEIDYQAGMCYTYTNLGRIAEMAHDTLKALECFMKSHAIFPNDVYALNDIAGIYFELDSMQKAIEFSTQAMNLAKKTGVSGGIRNAAYLFKEIYRKQHKPAEALEMFELFIKMRDSLNNDVNKKISIKSQLQYEYDKKEMLIKAEQDRQALVYRETTRSNKLQYELAQEQEKMKSETEKQKLAFNENLKRLKLNEDFNNQKNAAKAEQEKKDISNDAQNRQKSLIIYSIIAGLLTVSVFSFYLFRRFRITQRQKTIIEEQKRKVDGAYKDLHLKNEEISAQRDEIEYQKDIIQIHQKEMIDSITYAKRIQDAILPPVQLIKKCLPHSFVLYKPKDIVAGDFYWMEKIDHMIFIAAADCTGHGVPGAMVSVVCSNGLDRAVKEFHLAETGKILDKVCELVIETFMKSSQDVKDGMDISLLAINTATNTVTWSGANNPLWYFENRVLKEITADKQPIGKSDNRRPFTTHAIDCKPGTTFYLFTDGYADQFGGPKGKKFKYKQFQESLFSTLDTEPHSQLASLDKTFENWKGQLEQVDDVCVIGLKL